MDEKKAQKLIAFTGVRSEGKGETEEWVMGEIASNDCGRKWST